ncbi:MAG: hypothetical protein P8P99_13860 [Maricaulis sp.]|jgi:hypothetical protein|nr:hypothetical protein [Maricaulis sp.]
MYYVTNHAPGPRFINAKERGSLFSKLLEPGREYHLDVDPEHPRLKARIDAKEISVVADEEQLALDHPLPIKDEVKPVEPEPELPETSEAGDTAEQDASVGEDQPPIQQDQTPPAAVPAEPIAKATTTPVTPKRRGRGKAKKAA